MSITGFTSQGMDFGHALAAVKEGKLIARAGWNGKSMFVFMRPADKLFPEFIQQVKSLPQSVKDYFDPGETKGRPAVEFTAYLCMKAADNTIVNGWLASQTDMLATDWTILN